MAKASMVITMYCIRMASPELIRFTEKRITAVARAIGTNHSLRLGKLATSEFVKPRI